MGRAINVPPGRVAVLTGKLPTFPKTKDGQSVMQSGQVRYFSLTGIDADPFSPFPSSAVHGISDDEIVLDQDRNYIIVYSRANERPANAYASDNVSWVNWGTQSELGAIARWVSVSPDWTFPVAPQENNLTYLNSDWASPQFDSTLIGVNWRKGFMGCYQPQVHYMTVEQFEVYTTDFPCDPEVAVSVADLPTVDEFELMVFPNPSTGIFNVQLKQPAASYEVLSVSGKQLFQGKISGKILELDLSRFPVGVYLLNVHVGEQMVSKKLFKQ